VGLKIEANTQRLRQIVGNLVDNAIKFTKEGGCVEIGLQQEKEAITLSVKDNGIGIDPREWEKIFQSFYQVEGGISREVGGVGLGLAITKQLVELYAGKIWLHSVPGEGSTFYVRFPRKDNVDSEGGGAQ
jgi:two-component system phosphate regulon sensor histidine kinase PhoR